MQVRNPENPPNSRVLANIEENGGRFGDYYICTNPRCTRFLVKVKHAFPDPSPEKCEICMTPLRPAAGTWGI